MAQRLQDQRLPNKKLVDIYDYDDRIRRVCRQMEDELSDDNVRLISDYNKMMVSISLSKATRLRHLQTLLSLSRLLGMDWKDVTKREIDDLAFKMVEKYGDVKGQETYSSFDHKKILKIFFRWFKFGSRDYKEVGDPPETKSIRLRRVKDNLARESLVTQEDQSKLLRACGENLRDRAFIDVQSEAGTRPGEILSLLIKHVKFDNYGVIIHVDDKTGPRPVRLIRSAPNLAAWIDAHPYRENQNAPLWIKIDRRYYGEMLTYAGARMIIKRRCEMAHLSKRVWLNLFRHSEATETARFLTEAEMKKRHGWTSDSKMPGRYVHLVNADVEEAILSHYGMIKDKEAGPKLPRKCHFCDMPNSPQSMRCTKCGRPLDLTAALKVDDANEARLSAIEEKLSLLLNALQR
jgi:integrase/recombinase XerD